MVNIVVIGAGLSGLICAKELLRLSSSTSTSTSTSTSNSNINDDIHIHILEARGRFGGRMYQQGGVDLGATWSWPRHDTALVKVAQELGIQFEKQYTNGMAISHIVPLEGNGKGTTQSAGRDVSPAGDGSIRFENGAASIIEKLVEELRASDRITFELNQEVTAITMTAEDPIAYEIKSTSTLTPPASSDNNTCSDPGNLSSMISASVVVLALPPQLAATISFSPPLSHQKLTAMEQTPTWMANTGKVAFIYDKPFWKEKGLSGTAFSRGGPMAQIWDASSEEGTSRKRYALSSFVFDDDLKYLEGGDESEAHIRDSPIMKELIEIFGKEAANPTRIVWKSWQIDPYTSVEAKQPNQLSSYQREVPFGHPLVSQSEKGIIFSGTETALNENGHMNGAVLAGIRAADEATKYLARGSK